MDKNQKGSSISHLAIFAGMGSSIALLFFLIVFITSLKAAVPHKYQNLKIPLLEVPPRAKIPPLNLPLNFAEQATQSVEMETVEFEDMTASPSSSAGINF